MQTGSSWVVSLKYESPYLPHPQKIQDQENLKIQHSDQPIWFLSDHCFWIFQTKYQAKPAQKYFLTGLSQFIC